MMNLIAGTGVEPEHITEKTETDFCMPMRYKTEIVI